MAVQSRRPEYSASADDGRGWRGWRFHNAWRLGKRGRTTDVVIFGGEWNSATPRN